VSALCNFWGIYIPIYSSAVLASDTNLCGLALLSYNGYAKDRLHLLPVNPDYAAMDYGLLL
jgi:hypothetical protein